MNISVSLALSMASSYPKSPSRNSSIRTITGNSCPTKISVYKGKSERPLGWKPRRSQSTSAESSSVKDMSMKKWDGAARCSMEWDGLRRDPELSFPAGDCSVHLYEQGQSKRGPAFKVPFEVLRLKNCNPLLERFLADDSYYPPSSDHTSHSNGRNTIPMTYDLYIPAPPAAAREQAFLFHTATRNFFAFVFGRSLVGSHLGGALVGLLNSMNEFRDYGEDNVEAIMDYMDEEGYGDMRNQPDHALAVLFFAEHFQFKDLYIDAFTHCVGMGERLHTSPGYEHLSTRSRALITRSRFEMEVRLDYCGRKLGSFLSDDLSEAHLGLSAGARAHLDKFRSFLQTHYIAKFGFYPPVSCNSQYSAFPTPMLKQLSAEFLKLYGYLVDSSITASDPIPLSHQGGICVTQTLQAFDSRHKYDSLLHPLPLLPEIEEQSSKPLINSRFSWLPKGDKMRPDPNLVTFAAMSKATNSQSHSLLDSSLVRAYRGFESDCVFSPRKAEKHDKLSQADARKVRWILIYTTLQTLISATRVPDEVRDTQNVPYNISVLTVGCPPWNEEQPMETILRSQTDQMEEDFKATLLRSDSQTTWVSPIISNQFLDIKPDIDHVAIIQKSQESQAKKESSPISPLSSRRGTIRKALSTLGNMPPLHQPKPQRLSYHEILVHGYGNGTNAHRVSTSSQSSSTTSPVHEEDVSSESGTDSSEEDSSWRWSNNSIEAADIESPISSVSGDSRRCSEASNITTTTDFDEQAGTNLGGSKQQHQAHNLHQLKEHNEPTLVMPLNIRKSTIEEKTALVTEVEISYEDHTDTHSIEHLFLHESPTCWN